MTIILLQIYVSNKTRWYYVWENYTLPSPKRTISLKFAVWEHYQTTSTIPGIAELQVYTDPSKSGPVDMYTALMPKIALELQCGPLNSTFLKITIQNLEVPVVQMTSTQVPREVTGEVRVRIPG